MHVTKIIPYRYWRNVNTGHKISIRGAAPYHREADKADWEIVCRGFTQLFNDNTTRNSGPLCEIKAHGERINLMRVSQLQDHAKRYPEKAAICKDLIREIPVRL